MNETERQDLWAELASGAESGWDYSARWSREISFNKTDPYGNLRKLYVRAIIPVDLNALLYADHAIVSLCMSAMIVRQGLTLVLVGKPV